MNAVAESTGPDSGEPAHPSRVAHLSRWLVPYATAFVASACIMIVEIVAGRLISRYLGQSLYTWTSVIGVVLAGISIGNYAGGRLADRFESRMLLSCLFILSSLSCFLAPFANHVAGESGRLIEMTWPHRILVHVTLTFIVPSIMLGCIGPVVGKVALSSGRGTGRTLGGVYAWGAAGSIFGTFLAGFYLIASLGTLAVLAAVGVILAVMGVLYGLRSVAGGGSALLALVAAWVGFGPGSAAGNLGRAIGMRERPGPDVLYQDESQYQYIAVKSVGTNQVHRGIYLDKMLHSEMMLGEPTNLLYRYAWVYQAIIDKFSPAPKPVPTLVIGGGGYTFPQYLEVTRPGSRVDVIEIDPKVTEAAVRACGLRSYADLHVYHMDARNCVSELLKRKARGEAIPTYRFILGDTFNDYSVPYPLTTLEFHRQLYELLADDGFYMLNMIDQFDSGRFLAAIVQTFRQVFPDVHVFFCHRNLTSRGTYVVVCAKRSTDLSDITERIGRRYPFYGRLLTDTELQSLMERVRPVTLTDDYAPVENLLADIVRRDIPDDFGAYCLREGLHEAEKGEMDKAIAWFEKAVGANQLLPQAFYNLGVAWMRKGDSERALQAFQSALEIDPNYVEVRNNAAVVLAKIGMADAAIVQLEEVLRQKPDNVEACINLASLQAGRGQVTAAVSNLQRAVAVKPDSALAHNSLGELLASQGRAGEAAEQFSQALQCDPTMTLARQNLARLRK